MRKHDKTSRFGAVFLALAMVLTMCLPGMAKAEEQTEEQTIDAIQVTNLKGNPTSVKAYQIVRYDDTKADPYQMVSGLEAYAFKDMLNPKGEEITKIAKAINKGTFTPETVINLNRNGDSETYENTKDIAPGYYIVLASGSAKYIYNPMLVGASQTTKGVKQMALNAEGELATTPAVAKQSVPSVEKTAMQKDSAVKKNEKDEIEKNKQIAYRIDTRIPTYDKTVYEAPQFSIEDKFSAGLTLHKNSIKVQVGGDAAQEGSDYTLSNVTDQGFTVAFSSAFILSHVGDDVVVTYDAELNRDALMNAGQNTNDVTIAYSNDPTKDTLNKQSDKTYNYTFALDGNLLGDKKNKTHELIKTGEDTWESQTGEHATAKRPISGAQFTLTSAEGNVYHATTDSEGLLNFQGLAAGQYTLKETVPPKGYTLNAKEIPVVIAATYNDGGDGDTGYRGTLKQYTVTVGEGESAKTNTYKIIYKNGEADDNEKVYKDVVERIVVNEDDDDNKEEVTFDQGTALEETDLGKNPDHAAEIKNTKLNGLPSTGGMGTYLFTILGVAVIAVAGGLYIKKRNS